MPSRHRKTRDNRPASAPSAGVKVDQEVGNGPGVRNASPSARRFRPSGRDESRRIPDSWWTLALVVALVALNLAVFAPVRQFNFVQLDDPAQVSENEHITGGVTPSAVRWAFTSVHQGYWMPAVSLSHMMDVQLYGLNAGGHHVTNLLLHIANTLLLFGFLRRTTGAPGRSAFVAALFAVHPLHVESVAWVTERKDVLSTLFWIVTMWAYVAWVRRGGTARYALVVVTLALGLMAKPMLVTLPFALLLLDVWPLGRLHLAGMTLRRAETRLRTVGIRDQGAGKDRREARDHAPGTPTRDQGPGTRTRDQGPGTRTRDQGPGTRDQLFPLVVEKLPLFALAIGGSLVAFLTQRATGAVSDLQAFTLALRAQNALVSYVSYLGKMVWPTRLVAFYPYPSSIPASSVVGALVLLALISAVVAVLGRRYPYLPFGWLWYLGTLVPVIGLVQVGLQSMADRFTYVPLIGIFVMIAWGVPDLLDRARLPGRRVALPLGAAIVVVACSITAAAQVEHWRDSVAMWTHTTEVAMNTDAYHADMALGKALREQGRIAEALGHLSEAVALQPQSSDAQYELGATLAGEGKDDEAIAPLSEALRLRSDFAEAHVALGLVLSRRQKLEEAIAHYEAALITKPDLAEAHSNLGALLAQQGRLQDALPHFAEAVRLKPAFENARVNLALALAATGRPQEALAQFNEVLRINPQNEMARRAVADLTAGRR